MTSHDIELGADLVTQAARLLRVMRRRHSLGSGPRVLSVLDQLGPSTVTALATAYQSSQPTMSGLVAQLEEQGWVTKSPHPQDTRASLVALTAAGTAELTRVRRTYGEDVAARIAAHPTLTTEQLSTAVEVLHELLSDLSTEDPAS